MLNIEILEQHYAIDFITEHHINKIKTDRKSAITCFGAYVLDKKTSLYEAVKTLGNNLGIDGLHPHVFRHTWATRAVTRGVSLSKVAMFLGDSEKTVRANYQHLAPDYLNDVFET